MVNVSSDSFPFSRPRSGRTHWVRSNLTPPAKDEEQRAPKQASNKRFVEPVRLNDGQRAKVLGLLERREIGDAESRELFVSAMEYDLAGCRDMQESTTDEPAAKSTQQTTDPADKVLAELGAAAKALAQRLGALDDITGKQLLQRLAAADTFKRSYESQYLTALQIELNQLATIVGPFEHVAKGPTQTIPAPSDAVRRFVQRAADTFGDCFEQEPTAKRGSPFLAAFKAVVSVSGIRIPTDPASIRAILG